MELGGSLNILSSLNFSVDLNNKNRYINKMKNKEFKIKINGKWVKESEYDYSKGVINEKIDKCMDLLLELDSMKSEEFNEFEMMKFENFCYSIRDLKMFE